MFETAESKGKRYAIDFDEVLSSLPPEQSKALVELAETIRHIYTDTDMNTRTKEYSNKMYVAFMNTICMYLDLPEEAMIEYKMEFDK